MASYGHVKFFEKGIGGAGELWSGIFGEHTSVKFTTGRVSVAQRRLILMLLFLL